MNDRDGTVTPSEKKKETKEGKEKGKNKKRKKDRKKEKTEEKERLGNFYIFFKNRILEMFFSVLVNRTLDI